MTIHISKVDYLTLTTAESFELLKQHVAYMNDLYKSDSNYEYGGENDSEKDHSLLIDLFEHCTGWSFMDESNERIVAFREWGERSLENEIPEQLLKLVEKIGLAKTC